MRVRRLVDFPYVLIRVRCDVCKRAGAYRSGPVRGSMAPTMAKNPADEPHPTWEVSHIKGTPALLLGASRHSESAIEEAMKRFSLKERVRERLAARRTKRLGHPPGIFHRHLNQI
jgi:hypothetical protein